MRREQAFSLIEIMIVLGIIGITLAVVPPLLGPRLDHSRMQSAARELAAGLQTARLQAVNSRKEVTLVLDTDKKSYQLDSRLRALHLPAAAGLLLITAEAEQLDEHSGAIRFYPDGSSSGGRIRLSLPDRLSYDVDVNWLTGKVTIMP